MCCCGLRPRTKRRRGAACRRRHSRRCAHRKVIGLKNRRGNQCRVGIEKSPANAVRPRILNRRFKAVAFPAPSGNSAWDSHTGAVQVRDLGYPILLVQAYACGLNAHRRGQSVRHAPLRQDQARCLAMIESFRTIFPARPSLHRVSTASNLFYAYTLRGQRRPAPSCAGTRSRLRARS